MRRRDLAVIAAAFALGRRGTRFAAAATSRFLIAVALGGDQTTGADEELVRGLREQGLEPERDFHIVYRSTNADQTKTTSLVAEVMDLKPTLIVSQTTLLSVEFKRATGAIPIVGTALTDPIGLGLAKSYAHPGGNVTGILAGASSPGKLVELLLEAAPKVKKVGVLFNPLNPGNIIGVKNLQAEMSGLSVPLVLIEARLAADIEPAFRQLTDASVGAVYLAQDAMFSQEREHIASLALAARLPTANGFRQFAEAGVLLTYGSSAKERWHLAGRLAGRILHGAPAGELPIEQQPKLELVINLKTAKAIGLDLPRALMARADEVIE